MSEKPEATGARAPAAATLTREEKRDARRHEILEAAERVFARSGYWNATTVDVAKEVGLTQPALYRYFDSKRTLFVEALVLREWEGVEAYVRAVQHPGSALDRLRALTRSALELTLAHPDMGRLRVQAAVVAAEDEEIRELVRTARRSLRSAYERLIRQGQEDGSVRSDAVPAAAAATLVSIAHDCDVGLVLGDDESGTTQAAATLETYLDSLSASPA
ncbi:MAG: TetR/AcrR family transcriptional regulator [Myxococcota bacterium]